MATGIFSDIEVFSTKEKHKLTEYLNKYGEDYMEKLPLRYGLIMKGRALATYKGIFPLRKVEDIIKSSGPCQELANSTHFHIDNYANYIQDYVPV